MAVYHYFQHFALLLVILGCKSINIDGWWTICDHHFHHHQHYVEMSSRYSHPIGSGSGGSGSYATKHRSFNQIYKVIVGNPFVHTKNIYSKTAIYPRTPVWNFKKDVPT